MSWACADQTQDCSPRWGVPNGVGGSLSEKAACALWTTCVLSVSRLGPAAHRSLGVCARLEEGQSYSVGVPGIFIRLFVKVL